MCGLIFPVSLLQRLGAARVVVTRDPPTRIPDDIVVLCEDAGRLSGWLQTHGVGAVVVRPDRYVFGAAANATGLNELIGCMAQTSVS